MAAESQCPDRMAEEASERESLHLFGVWFSAAQGGASKGKGKQQGDLFSLLPLHPILLSSHPSHPHLPAPQPVWCELVLPLLARLQCCREPSPGTLTCFFLPFEEAVKPLPDSGFMRDWSMKRKQWRFPRSELPHPHSPSTPGACPSHPHLMLNFLETPLPDFYSS